MNNSTKRRKRRATNNAPPVIPPIDFKEPLQVIGTPDAFMSGRPPKMREMTLDDIEDECDLCLMNRERILAGDPPTVMAYD